MNKAELLAKISKGTATPEEIQDLTNLINSQDELAAKATKVLEENKTLKSEKDTLAKTAKEQADAAKAAADALLKVNTNVRVAQLNTWLATRSDKDTLTTKIGSMSDEDFELFKEGKTDAEIKANKDAVAAAAVKPAAPAAPAAPKTPLIPNSEIIKQGEQEEKEKSTGFPKTAEIKDMFGLADNALYHNIEGFEKKAEAYLAKPGRYIE